MSQKQSFGIMDEGYFVPRTQILDWLNNLLNLNLTKIEQLGSGAVYCQVIDVIHPGKISLSKVNWRAKNDYQFIANLKILQSAFDKIGIKRYVEVEKLARAKYQDNLQFIQWLKRYYDINCGSRGEGYQGDQKRGGVPVDFSFAQKNVVPKSYNGSGQVIPKNEKVQNIQKKTKDQYSNVVSTMGAYKAETKKQSNSNSSPSSAPKKSGNQDSSKMKQLQQKLNAIKKIALSTESAEKKMQLIEEALNIQKEEQQHDENIQQQAMEDQVL